MTSVFVVIDDLESFIRGELKARVNELSVQERRLIVQTALGYVNGVLEWLVFGDKLEEKLRRSLDGWSSDLREAEIEFAAGIDSDGRVVDLGDCRHHFELMERNLTGMRTFFITKAGELLLWTFELTVKAPRDRVVRNSVILIDDEKLLEILSHDPVVTIALVRTLLDRVARAAERMEQAFRDVRAARTGLLGLSSRIT